MRERSSGAIARTYGVQPPDFCIVISRNSAISKHALGTSVSESVEETQQALTTVSLLGALAACSSNDDGQSATNSGGGAASGGGEVCVRTEKTETSCSTASTATAMVFVDCLDPDCEGKLCGGDCRSCVAGACLGEPPLPPVPKIDNVVVTMRGDTAIIDFSAVDKALESASFAGDSKSSRILAVYGFARAGVAPALRRGYASTRGRARASCFD